MTDARSSGARQAALHLRELLLRPGQYRRRWEQFVERSRPGELNQHAVAEVLAEYLWDHPRVERDREVQARQLKDTVNRMVTKKMLSKVTLELFIDAFNIPELEEEQLWKLWEGSDRLRVLVGPRALPPHTAAALVPAGHRTVSLHEHHYLGADGLPSRHRTLQVIEAIVDGVDRYPYRFDTDALTVEVGQGCAGLVGPVYDVTPGLCAVDILLNQPLHAGETLTLEYWTSFHYARAPKPEFRRVARDRIDSVDIRVEFHPDRRPDRVWWAVWDGYGGEVTSEEEVSLDGQGAVERYLRIIEDTAVGFHWEWPETMQQVTQDSLARLPRSL